MTAWALDPWRDDIRFLAVPDRIGGCCQVPDPMPIVNWSSYRFGCTPIILPTWRQEYQSPQLGRVVVYVSRSDQDRLLAALLLAEGAVLLLAWLGGVARLVPS